MSDIMFVGKHPAKKIRFASEPIYNALCSLCLLSQDHLDNISSWVDVTKQHMTDDERRQAERACHAAPFVGLRGTAVADAADLSVWLERLADIDPSDIRTVGATRLHRKALENLEGTEIPSIKEILSSQKAYVDLVAALCAVHGHEHMCDRAEEEAIFDEMRDGTVYRDKLIDGIRHLSERYLVDEWPRVASTIETSVKAFESIEVPGATIVDQLMFISEREAIPEEWVPTLEKAGEVVYIPSVHIGPFMSLFEFDGTTAYIVGRARIPEGSTVRAIELDRSDLLIRLDALSDDARLRILELAGDRGVITTQEVMDALDLSQSSASRHLTQLTATGLLAVDASERTKRYRLNGARVDQVFSGLKDLLGARTQA